MAEHKKRKTLVRHLQVVLRRYMRQAEISGNKKAFFRDRFHMLKNAAKGWRKPFPKVFLDCMGALIFHGQEIEYYIIDDMYQYSFREKKQRLTVWRNFVLDYKYNIQATDQEKARLIDKKVFNECYKDFIGRDWCYAPDETVSSLRQFISRHKTAFCKPYNLSWGKGIFTLNENAADEELQYLIDNRYVVEETLRNHPELNELNSASVNSLRLFSIIDREGTVHTGLPFIKIGIGNAVVDNLAEGGLAYVMDGKTGRINYPGKSFYNTEKYYYHPGSSREMIGMNVPYYKEACEMLKKAAKVTPSLRLIGWDIAITPEGPVLIEGNIEYALILQGKEGLYEETKKYL